MVLDTYNPIWYQKKQNGSKIDMYVNVNKNNIKDDIKASIVDEEKDFGNWICPLHGYDQFIQIGYCWMYMISLIPFGAKSYKSTTTNAYTYFFHRVSWFLTIFKGSVF